MLRETLLSLDRISSGRSQHNDRAGAQRRAKDYIKFIYQNRTFFDKLRNGSTYKQAAESMFKQHAPFTDKQLSYIDVLYEKVMKGAGFPAVENTYKHNNRNTLRYGNR